VLLSYFSGLFTGRNNSMAMGLDDNEVNATEVFKIVASREAFRVASQGRPHHGEWHGRGV
jgi:hypothetical protein